MASLEQTICMSGARIVPIGTVSGTGATGRDKPRLGAGDARDDITGRRMQMVHLDELGGDGRHGCHRGLDLQSTDAGTSPA